jgi:hypothetical protein
VLFDHAFESPCPSSILLVVHREEDLLALVIFQFRGYKFPWEVNTFGQHRSEDSEPILEHERFRALLPTAFSVCERGKIKTDLEC